MRSPILLPMRMNAAETSASSAMALCTPLTVVPRSSTTFAIDTFMSDVSTTSTNIAIARSTARRRLPDANAGLGAAISPPTSASPVTSDPPPSDDHRVTPGERASPGMGEVPWAAARAALCHDALVVQPHQRDHLRDILVAV